MDDGRTVHGPLLFFREQKNGASFQMRHPDTSEYVTVCPFQRRVAKECYLCGLHTVKPEMCCTYLP
jgi:hypothetical protein